MISIALPISLWRQKTPLLRSHWRVTKIFAKFCASIYCTFVKFYHKFGFHIETLTNNLALLSFKHVKLNANDEKLPCKHSNRLLPSPSWILVTHSDLGNEFPFRYRDRPQLRKSAFCFHPTIAYTLSWLRHSWKALGNRLTRDQEVVIHSSDAVA